MGRGGEMSNKYQTNVKQISNKYQTMGGGGEGQNMNIFRIAFQTIEHLLPWKAESKPDTGGRYVQELINSYGQVPGKGKPTNIWQKINDKYIFQSNIITELWFCYSLFEFDNSSCWIKYWGKFLYRGLIKRNWKK